MAAPPPAAPCNRTPPDCPTLHCTALPLDCCVQGLRGRREAEWAALGHLVSAPPVVQPEPGRPYCLAPVAFMARWRAYMAQAGKRGAAGATTPGEASRGGAWVLQAADFTPAWRAVVWHPTMAVLPLLSKPTADCC